MTDIQSTITPVVGRGVRKARAEATSSRAIRKAARPAMTPPPPPEPIVELASEPVVRSPAKGKLGDMVTLMRRPEGASMADLMTATGWQAHSVRGALAGSLKRARGYEINSDKIDGVRTYTIASDTGGQA